MLSESEKQKIRAEMEYRESIDRDLAKSRPKGIAAFFGHAFTVAVLGGALIAMFQFIQWKKEDTLTRREQLQDKQYALLANFSDQFDQYMALLVNVRYEQNFFIRCTNNPKATDFLGRTKAEVMPMYMDIVRQLHERPRAEAVLVSVRAMFHSSDVINKLDALDNNVLALQHSGDDNKPTLTDLEIAKLDQNDDELVRDLAEAMNKELAAK